MKWMIYILIGFWLMMAAGVASAVETVDGLAPHVIEQKTDEIRSPATVRNFKRISPCPVNGRRSGLCPGYVVDHVLPLKCDGPDSVKNMQWQTKRDSLLKDRWEIHGDATHKPCSGLPS